MKLGEIRALTGLRGIAAILVVAYHFQVVPQSVVGPPPAIGPGYLMVDLFFVLSGFVMARTYGAAFNDGMSWPRYGGFLEARFARVYPLYALVCGSVLLLTKLHLMTSAWFPVRAFIADMLMVQNLGVYWIGRSFADYLDPPSWSISTEFGAYLLFPALAIWALHRSKRAAIALVLVCVGTLVWLTVMPHTWRRLPFNHDPLNISSGLTLWPLARCLAGFCLGLVAYRVAGGVGTARRSWGDIALLVAIGFAWALPKADVLVVILFPFLILQVCEDSTPLARCLASPIPYRLGVWSYAIYLLHWPALSLFRPILSQLQRFGIAHAWELSLCLIAALVVAASAAVHSIIEKPARAALRKIFHRRARAIQLEPSAP